MMQILVSRTAARRFDRDSLGFGFFLVFLIGPLFLFSIF